MTADNSMAVRYAVVSHNITSMRAEPTEGAEIVSQAILGEAVEILGEEGCFLEIATPDEYRGWVLAKHLLRLADGAAYPAERMKAVIRALFLPVLREPRQGAERVTTLVYNSHVETDWTRKDGRFLHVSLPSVGLCYVQDAPFSINHDEAYGFVYPVQNELYHRMLQQKVVTQVLAHQAMRFVGTPYLWGGRSPFGVDCSGFIQLVYGYMGMTLPRDAYLQARSDRFAEVDREEIAEGDLLYFLGESDPRGRGITHTGMALGDNRFIHACGADGVIVSSLIDPPYDRQLRCARRLKELL